eukprot:TRINITY_DN2615_c0_g1_i1.p2 TRINITY_DN2615_c0_g1~~TRINITY_DN2615_c0_g1_i1.p2  ORF type:complete len:65 (+),score=15.05 TRINITY_DN2615_c0_g1_i1:533-727(+)
MCQSESSTKLKRTQGNLAVVRAQMLKNTTVAEEEAKIAVEKFKSKGNVEIQKTKALRKKVKVKK